MQKNCLYYGDNLTVLREHIKDESVDLIYLDPPFNSRQDYNVLFAEKDGTRSSSQIMAFEDTWEWNIDAEAAYEEIVERGGRVSDAMRAFRTLLGHSDMMAYLAMMAPRLNSIARSRKPDRSTRTATQHERPSRIYEAKPGEQSTIGSKSRGKLTHDG